MPSTVLSEKGRRAAAAGMALPASHRRPEDPVALALAGGVRLLAAAACGLGPGLREHRELHGPLLLPQAAKQAAMAQRASPGRHGSDWESRFCDELESAGLGGRGGAGFPTARKLAAAGLAGATTLLVNAMEGEPASRKDDVLLNASPHLVLDGAELAAAVIGAGRVLLCLDRRRAATAALLERAIAERRLDPTPIAGGASEVELRLLEGRYLAGEESALVAAAAGAVAVPRFRPDKSIPLRLGRRPAIVHNVETLAHVALVARHGAHWFRSAGTAESPGTCLVTVSGAIASPTVLELPFGTPLRTLLSAAGVGMRPQAVLAGGYGGAWLGPDALDCAWSAEGLRPDGGSTGAGVVVALPPGACGLAETASIAAFMAGESAGQCGPCAFGLPAIARDLAEIADPGGSGRGSGTALERLLRRCELVEDRGACRHPDGVARLVQSALRVFSADVEAHLAGRPCAGSAARPFAPLPSARRGAG